nr:hypothetical protein [Tanacetum cinerariifolium]
AVQSESPVLTSKPVTSPISELVIAPFSASKPNPKASIPYLSRRNDERNHEKANNQIEKFYQIFKDMSFEISFADALILMPKFALTLKALIGNKEKLRDPGKFLIPCDFPELADRSISCSVGVAEDVYVKVGSFHFPANFVVVDFDADPRVLLILRRSFLKTGRALIDVFEGSFGFFDTISSGNPTPFYDSIVSATSPTLTPFENSDFLLEEVDVFLAIEDKPTSSEFHQSYLDPEGNILLLESFLNDDPLLSPLNQRNYVPEVRKELKICEAKFDKSLVDEPPVVELKVLSPYLEYAFLEVPQASHRLEASDIKGINPEFGTHKILMEEDFTPAVQHQRRVNPKIHDVIKQEVIKLLDTGLIYPIPYSPWASPLHCVPKKGGFTVVENEDNELILTRLVMGWRVCIDYRKLNEATLEGPFFSTVYGSDARKISRESVLPFS